MKLALVHDWLTGMRGGEKCLEVLCRAYPQSRLYTLFQAPGQVSSAIESLPITTSPLQRLPGVRRYYRYLLPLMPWAIERLRMPDDVSAVVSFSHAVAKGVTPPAGVPHLCYCFTPMRYAWSERAAYFGHGDGSRLRQFCRWPFAAARDRMLDRIQAWDRRASERVTHFIAISQTVAQRISDCYGRPSTIIYPPVDTDFYTPTEQPREDFYLVVSALVPYKRIDHAIAACRRLGKRLIVIGQGPERARLSRGADDRCTFLGWQTDEAIRDHLRRCRGLLFPGLEDFGIVPLEAQACGAPVIALGQGGAAETVLPATAEQPGTGVLYAEPTVAALCAAIETYEGSPEQVSAGQAVAHAQRFSLPRFTRELTAFVEATVAGASRQAADSAVHSSSKRSSA